MKKFDENDNVVINPGDFNGVSGDFLKLDSEGEEKIVWYLTKLTLTHIRDGLGIADVDTNKVHEIIRDRWENGRINKSTIASYLNRQGTRFTNVNSVTNKSISDFCLFAGKRYKMYYVDEVAKTEVDDFSDILAGWKDVEISQ